MRGHLALTRDGVQRLASQEPEHQLGLPLEAPAFRQLGGCWCTRPLRERAPLPALRAHGPAPLVPVMVVKPVSRETGSDLGGVTARPPASDPDFDGDPPPPRRASPASTAGRSAADDR